MIMLQCDIKKDGFTITFRNIILVSHNAENPFITLYRGTEAIDMYRGNFFISDTLADMCRLSEYEIDEKTTDLGTECFIRFYSGTVSLSIRLVQIDGRFVIYVDPFPKDYNRIRFSFFAESGEHVYGCGEQFSFFDLRGKNFPLWTGEQGVGRNKENLLTRLMDEKDRSGGDYYTTFYPQPTYVSSRGYYLHARTFGYADFDFSVSDRHTLLFWNIPEKIIIGAKDTLLETVQDISLLLGRQSELPPWIYDGIILGIQGGTETCRKKLKVMQEAGCPVAAIWAQDWEGQKITGFGKRLKWNWVYDNLRYPDLPQTIRDFADMNVRFLGYINPYVLENESLYTEALNKCFLVLNKQGKPYLVDFGEFYAGIVDFTNPAAREWYTGVIQQNLIGIGMSGWMADFGEYLPTDVILYDASDPLTAHNAWPGYWAKINKDAVMRSHKEDECLFFMRAGNADSLKFCTMMWAGDQNVDWSDDDGIPSALTAALSLAMCGMGLHHSDIGGYTTVRPYLRRSKQLLLRWVEFSAFTVLMRTHEGNIPEDNWQFDGDQETVEFFARMSSVHKMLKPYLQNAVRLNYAEGIPVILPVFLSYPSEDFFVCKDEYLLGRDVLVAPVFRSSDIGRRVLLPDDTWIHLFTGRKYLRGNWYVDAPLGYPAVFYRENSSVMELFESICAIYGTKS